MNKHLYRVVFNQHRGQLMVVAESATANGKADSGEPAVSVSSPSLLTTLRPLALALFVALGMVTVFAPITYAQVVADPGAPASQRPNVLLTANGLPQINIQTPSAAGVSRNTYSQFDVQRAGVVLNNSRTDVQSQLGGWVQGNPWLAGGSARIIVNEVNSVNPSQLRGYVEVAGQRAEVIIANPAGINIDGAGFINASGATLTTGVVNVNNGALEGYRVERGTISIDGQGLDARTTDYTGILARAVQLNAGVWANELRVATGASQIDAPQSGISAVSGAGPAPAFALDIAQLGGMYANKIC